MITYHDTRRFIYETPFFVAKLAKELEETPIMKLMERRE